MAAGLAGVEAVAALVSQQRASWGGFAQGKGKVSRQGFETGGRRGAPAKDCQGGGGGSTGESAMAAALAGVDAWGSMERVWGGEGVLGMACACL